MTPQTIRLVAHEKQHKLLNEGGFGEEEIFRGILDNASGTSRVGIFAGRLTSVSSNDSLNLAIVDLQLPGGQITIQGFFFGTRSRIVHAITGGTGTYRDAGRFGFDRPGCPAGDCSSAAGRATRDRREWLRSPGRVHHALSSVSAVTSTGRATRVPATIGSAPARAPQPLLFGPGEPQREAAWAASLATVASEHRAGMIARWAGGCTSGHGLSGCAAGSPDSLAATATFFAVAVAVSFAAQALSGGAL